MAHAIPKIHFLISEITGDTTSGSDSVTNVSDTTDVQVGMYITGTGIPADATVLAKTSSTIQLSANATANGTAVAIETFKKIEFDFPPIEKSGEKLNPQERRSISLSGISQVSIDYIEGVRALNFSHLTNTKYLAFKAFYDESAVYGESFRYYDDKTLTDYINYELRSFDWDGVKIASRGTSYVWAVPVQFRRAVL
jgi:hypothetical protein